MWKLVIRIVVCCLLISTNGFAQDIDEEDSLARVEVVDTVWAMPSDVDTTFVPLPMVENRFSYRDTRIWQRNRVKNLAGGMMLGLGTLSLGYYALVRTVFKAEDFNWLDAVWGGGSAALISASIPLFISARKDRVRAKSLSDAELVQLARRENRKYGLRYEVSFGGTVPLSDDDYYGYDTKRLGWGLGIEARTYLGSSNFDLGVKLGYDRTVYEGVIYNYDYTVNEPCKGSKASLRLSLLGDYNFCKGKKVNPYIGMGIGTDFVNGGYFVPRVGIELFDHHRISSCANISFDQKNSYSESKLHSNICFSYGYTF